MRFVHFKCKTRNVYSNYLLQICFSVILFLNTIPLFSILFLSMVLPPVIAVIFVILGVVVVVVCWGVMVKFLSDIKPTLSLYVAHIFTDEAFV